MFITNDPAFGGVTHLSDVVVIQPVFAEGRLVAFAASIAHWNDIGGRTPGSMSVDATEIFHEGLRLPAVRLFEAGRPVVSVFDIIAANSRQPDVARGDLWAQIAAARRAEARIAALVRAYGAATWDAALAALMAEGAARAAAGLRALPPGRYSIEEPQDDGALWRAVIEVSADRFRVDLRGNPAQRAAPYNTSRDGAVISAQMIFKALTDPELFTNAGSFAALEVLTDPGSVFHATGTAPHGYYFETRIRLYDMLWRCMAQALPEQLPAGHFGSICGTVLAGVHPDTGRGFTMVEPQMGGWGATCDRDGLDAMYSASHGETFNCPVEIAEARYGLHIGCRRLREGTGGAGRHRGGRGVELHYGLRAPAVLSAGYSRATVPVWGLAGGAAGDTNTLEVRRADGAVERHAFVSGLSLGPGDTVVVRTAGGGGWGDA